MQVTDEGIVISRVAYGDSALIVNILTRAEGLQGFYIPGARTSKSKSKALLFAPMNRLKFVTSYRKKEGLLKLKQAELVSAQHNIVSDPVKQTVVLFMAELLNKCLSESQQDESLYAFLALSIQSLNKAYDTSGYPISFLMQLSEHLGFYPDDTDDELFCLESGCFIPSSEVTSSSLNETESALFRKCLAGDIASLKRVERSILLQVWLRYYDIHHPGTGSLKSIDVIQAVLRD